MQVFQAAQTGNIPLLQKLAARGLNGTTDDKWTVMHFAVLGGNVESVRFLIRRDISVNSQTLQGQSPLHLAAESGNEVIIALLVENGAILDQADKNVSPFFLWRFTFFLIVLHSIMPHERIISCVSSFCLITKRIRTFLINTASRRCTRR